MERLMSTQWYNSARSSNRTHSLPSKKRRFWLEYNLGWWGFQIFEVPSYVCVVFWWLVWVQNYPQWGSFPYNIFATLFLVRWIKAEAPKARFRAQKKMLSNQHCVKSIIFSTEILNSRGTGMEDVSVTFEAGDDSNAISLCQQFRFENNFRVWF